MKHLYLLRHAKTNQESPTGSDFDRELLPKGLHQLKELNRYFERYPLNKQTNCWVSSAKRTRQTYEGIQATIDVLPPVFFEDLYLVSHTNILNKLWKHTSGNDLLIIGHNFGISDLAGYFSEYYTEMATGEFIHLTFTCDSWAETSRGLATVAHRFRPLKDLLP